MRVAVEDNPNCEGSPEQVFAELGPARPIKGLWIEEDAKRLEHDVVGINASGLAVQAYAMKIADSSEGHAYLIYGGAWGIRLRASEEGGAWDVDSAHQKGEPFKIYGDEEDIIYADA